MSDYTRNGFPKADDYFDKLENYWEPLHYKKKKGGQNRMGQDVEPIIPKEGEIRLLGNRHRQCQYYTLGKSSPYPNQIQAWMLA